MKPKQQNLDRMDAGRGETGRKHSGDGAFNDDIEDPKRRRIDDSAVEVVASISDIHSVTKPDVSDQGATDRSQYEDDDDCSTTNRKESEGDEGEKNSASKLNSLVNSLTELIAVVRGASSTAASSVSESDDSETDDVSKPDDGSIRNATDGSQSVEDKDDPDTEKSKSLGTIEGLASGDKSKDESRTTVEGRKDSGRVQVDSKRPSDCAVNENGEEPKRCRLNDSVEGGDQFTGGSRLRLRMRGSEAGVDIPEWLDNGVCMLGNFIDKMSNDNRGDCSPAASSATSLELVDVAAVGGSDEKPEESENDEGSDEEDDESESSDDEDDEDVEEDDDDDLDDYSTDESESDQDD